MNNNLTHQLFNNIDKQAIKLSSYYKRRLPKDILDNISIKYYNILTIQMKPLYHDLTNEDLIEIDLLKQFGINN